MYFLMQNKQNVKIEHIIIFLTKLIGNRQIGKD